MRRTARPKDQPSTGPPRTQAGPVRDQAARHQAPTGSGPPARTRLSPRQDHSATARTTRPAPPAAQQQMNQAHLIARKLAAEGKPVSRRTLRSGGARGSNQALSTLARKVNAEQAANPAGPDDATDAGQSRFMEG